MRKHLYLITESDDEVVGVGDQLIMSRRFERHEKNKERPLIKHVNGDFIEYGKAVHLGYADFEDEEDMRERMTAVVRQKFTEIDEKWLIKAEKDPEKYK